MFVGVLLPTESDTYGYGFGMIRLKHTHLILGFIILMFVADAANAILVYLNSPLYRVSLVVRLIAQIYFSCLLLFKRKGQLMLLAVFCLYGIFAIGTLSAVNLFDEYDVFENFIIVNKILFFLICWATLDLYFGTARSYLRLMQIYEVLVWIEVAAVIVGFVFRLDVLSSYSSVGGIRSGYKGLIPAQNETSGFFIIAFFYSLWKVHYLRRGIPLLVAVLGANMLTGTKVSFALPAVLILYLCVSIGPRLLNGRLLKLQASLVLILLLAGVLVAANWNYVLDRAQNSVDYFTNKLEMEHWDYTTLFFSGRNQTVQRIIDEILPQFGVVNYLFGGMDLSSISAEMDFIDILARFGLLGGVMFLGVYLYILVRSLKHTTIVAGLFLVTWLGVAATAGHLVYSAINAMYLAILLVALSLKEDPWRETQIATNRIFKKMAGLPVERAQTPEVGTAARLSHSV